MSRIEENLATYKISIKMIHSLAYSSMTVPDLEVMLASQMYSHDNRNVWSYSGVAKYPKNKTALSAAFVYIRFVKIIEDKFLEIASQ